MQRRLPIVVVVRVLYGADGYTNEEEKTFTDNISPLGARVFSKQAKQPGDLLWITAVNEEPVLGEVVYCQHLPDDRYGLGVKFEGGPVAWSILERYARP